MNIVKNITQKCSCNVLNRLGPPPVYLLEPPPMPPLPIEYDNLIISSSKSFESLMKCSMPPNRNKPTNTDLLMSNMNNSYFVITIVVIVILIVLLLLFILFAFIIVYLTRLKLKKSENLNQSKSSSDCSNKHESQQTVSVLTLTSPSFTQLSNSPNSTNSYVVEDRNLIFDHPKIIPLNSFSKLPLHENTFKPIQNGINNMCSSVSSSYSSSSPNKQPIGNESIEINRTNRTILAQSARPVKKMTKVQNENQQHYYESIGDLSQLYFDVDDQNIYKKNLSRFVIPESIAVNNYQVSLDFDKQHYPITCCSCTLMKYNQNVNHSCSTRNINSQLNNGIQFFYDNQQELPNTNRFQLTSSSNLNTSNYLKSLIV